MCASVDCTHSHRGHAWANLSIFVYADVRVPYFFLTSNFWQLFSILTIFTVWFVCQKSLGSHDLPLTLHCEISDWGDGPVCCAVWVTGVSLLLCQSNTGRCNVPALSETPNTSQWNANPTWSRLFLRHLRNRQREENVCKKKKIEAELVLLLENRELHVVECVV